MQLQTLIARAPVVVLCLGMLALPARADDCFDSPAVCHQKAGEAALSATPSNPHLAVEEFFASYKADGDQKTYAYYAYALRLDAQYALSYAIWTRIKTRLHDSLDDARRRAAEAQQRHDDVTGWNATITALEKQIKNAENELTLLESKTAKVQLQYANPPAPSGLLVARKDGDIKDPFKDLIVVNADNDTLVVTYPDGTTKDLAINVAGGQQRTVVVPAHEAPVAVPPVTEVTPPITTIVKQPPPPEPQPQSHTKRWVGGAVLGVGAIAIGAAIVFQIQSNHDFDDATAPGAGCVDNQCLRGSRGATLAQDSQDRAHLALASAIGGGALAAAGTVLILLDHTHRESASSSATLRVIPRDGGLAAVVTGRF